MGRLVACSTAAAGSRMRTNIGTQLLRCHRQTGRRTTIGMAVDVGLRRSLSVV
jgi:hypothetical protein